jgi:hypothetical protein
MRYLWLWLMIGLATPLCAAAQVQGVGFSFEPRPEAKMPVYSIALAVSGNGRYREGDEQPGRVMTASDATMATLLAVRNRVVPGTCETHHSNIAKTGRKTLTVYMDGPGEGAKVACEFEYSDDARLNAAVAAYQAMAESMQFGTRLEHAHRFDRLGLDAEMDALIAENKAGRAIELQNIAATLQSIEDDERVMERVRVKAGRLLQAAGVDMPVPTSAR